VRSEYNAQSEYHRARSQTTYLIRFFSTIFTERLACQAERSYSVAGLSRSASCLPNQPRPVSYPLGANHQHTSKPFYIFNQQTRLGDVAVFENRRPVTEAKFIIKSWLKELKRNYYSSAENKAD
jgi:hypothetical protein